MKIFSAAQVREWDLFTIKHEPISSIALMERAAQKCVSWIIGKQLPQSTIKIFCAKGNNGGDGLAIARLLAEKNIESQVYILEFGIIGTNDFQANLHRIHEHTKDIHFIQDESFFPFIDEKNIVIDALYGSGLNRPLEGLSKALAEHINSSNATVISIDVPSGMYVDKSSVSCPVVMADYTITFQTLKLCFLLPENEDLLGEVSVLDIGLHNEFEQAVNTTYEVIGHQLIQSIYKPRKKFSHKGTFGHSLIIAGSKGKIGAAVLATKACLRSGAGLVTAMLPELGLPIMQTALPEAMTITSEEIENINLENYAAIGIGPGLGNTHESTDLLVKILNNYNKPLVIDADALNIIADQKQALSFLPPGSILTPHPKEYERIFGKSKNDFERLKTASKIAQKLHCFIILKGHYSFVACPTGKGYFNNTGNAGMATAGSGDVLTGIITGLLSQGYSSLHAALLGVYIHGLAGDIGASKRSQEALIAGDIIDYLGEAYKAIGIADKK
jgi:NAD(P)H-hydrate epimerase